MKVVSTAFKDLFILEPSKYKDNRGYFFESFNQKVFEKETSLSISFVQDNQSHSSYGVLRGLHFQKGSSAQAKLVRVLSGKVLDVVVDLRSGSTFGKVFSIELSAENNLQLFIPRGFAHGFVVLSETADFFYKCDNYYDQKAEGGINFADSDLAIDWKISSKELLVSEKDIILPSLREINTESLSW